MEIAGAHTAAASFSLPLVAMAKGDMLAGNHDWHLVKSREKPGTWACCVCFKETWRDDTLHPTYARHVKYESWLRGSHGIECAAASLEQCLRWVDTYGIPDHDWTMAKDGLHMLFKEAEQLHKKQRSEVAKSALPQQQSQPSIAHARINAIVRHR